MSTSGSAWTRIVSAGSCTRSDDGQLSRRFLSSPRILPFSQFAFAPRSLFAARSARSGIVNLAETVRGYSLAASRLRHSPVPRSSLRSDLESLGCSGLRLVWFKSLSRRFSRRRARSSLRSSLAGSVERKRPERDSEPEADVLAHFVRSARLPGFKSSRSRFSRPDSLVAIAPRSLFAARSARSGI